MQLTQRVAVGALVVPALLASLGLAAYPAAEGHLVLAVRSSEIVLAGTALSGEERQEVVDAVRALTALRVTDVITADAGERLPVSAAVAAALLGAVLAHDVTEFTGVVHGGRLAASARVADRARAGSLSDALRSAAPGLRVDEDFTTTS